MKSRQAAALILALLMLCAMLPRQRTLAEAGATLHIAGKDYTTEELGSDIVGTGWRWSAEKNEITLSGYKSGYIKYYGTPPKQDVSILVAAGTNNSITVPADLTEHGIHVGRDLSLSGAGNLSIAINRVYHSSNDEDYDGIYSNDGSISIDMAGKLDISVKDFCGIRARNHVTLSGTGDVKISAECGIWSLRGHVNSTMAGKLTIDARSIGIITENLSYAAGDIKLSGNGAVIINSGAHGISAELGNVSLSGNGAVSITLAANNGATYGIYAHSNVDLSNNGAVTINADKFGVHSETMGVSLSGDGDVSITTGDGNSERGYGIYADNDVNLSGSGDVIIDVEGKGIISYFYGVSLSGDGDVSITATNDGIYANDGVTISGSGAVSITVHDSHTYTSGGIYTNNEDVIVSGSGKLTVSSDKDAVYLWDKGKELKLNGTGTPLTFTSGEGYRAIYNGRDDSSPVGGTEYHNYRETGAPNGTYVRYDHKSSVVETVELTAPSASKTYDGTALTKTTGVSATGLPEGYTVEATASGSQTDVGSSDNVVNEGYVIRDAGGNDKTADFPNVTKVNGTLTVTPATLTIRADNKTREYNTANPMLTYSVEGLQGEDCIITIGLDPAISTTAILMSPVGGYPITFGGPAVLGNYNVSYVDGTLTVKSNSVDLTLAATGYNGTYDGADHNGVTGATASLPDAVITYSLNENGPYSGDIPQVHDVTPGTVIWVKASLANYEDARTSVTAVVTAATLTITADNKTREYNTANPELTYSVSGLQGTDSIASIGLDPAISTTAVQTSPVGGHPITFGGPTVLGNYNVNYVDGILTVTPQVAPTTTESTETSSTSADPTTTESTETSSTSADPTTTESTETSSTSADPTTTESTETTPTTTDPTTTESTETSSTSADPTTTESTETSSTSADPPTTESTETTPTTSDPTTTESTETTPTTTDPTTTESTETSSTSADPTTTESTETTPTTTDPTSTESTETTPTTTAPTTTESATTTPTTTESTETIPTTTTPTSTESTESTPTTTAPTSTEKPETDPSQSDEIRMIKQAPAWIKGSLLSASYTSNASFADFLYVRVDGNVVDRSNYDVEEGSTIVSFKAKYLETLSVGKHPVEIVSKSGTAHGMIEIKGPAAGQTEETTKSGDSVPRTGESVGQYLWLALLLLAAGGMLLVLRKKNMLKHRD
ncbi:MAG: MBG domain-containing protein [Bacillota bacterium]|nr:MBG domain-containing protein [Bacillota bacterium]